MENINIEKIYYEETRKYNFYINNKEVDFLEFYKCFRDAFFKNMQQKEDESRFTVPWHIQLEQLQSIFDTIKQSGNEYNCCNYTFRIEKK